MRLMSVHDTWKKEQQEDESRSRLFPSHLNIWLSVMVSVCGSITMYLMEAWWIYISSMHIFFQNLWKRKKGLQILITSKLYSYICSLHLFQWRGTHAWKLVLYVGFISFTFLKLGKDRKCKMGVHQIFVFMVS